MNTDLMAPAATLPPSSVGHAVITSLQNMQRGVAVFTIFLFFVLILYDPSLNSEIGFKNVYIMDSQVM